MSSWLSSFYHGQTKSDIEILYLYKEALQKVSVQNAFYSSKEDYDFLNACLDFIKMAKTYQIQDFPCSTQKEKDLNEILNFLYPWQQAAARHLSTAFFFPFECDVDETQKNICFKTAGGYLS